MTESLPTNRLAGETSPYLLQHAHNPVDWYPWGAEALARAKAEDKPILLSVGYAACHWCHVMERESFEDEAIARAMNEGFVCIKVDREERPDLDQLYQTALQLFGGHGGWPLTMFLTPELEPFFGGTYFPDRPRYGMPSFAQLLAGIADAYRTRRAQVATSAGQLTQLLRQVEGGEEAGGAAPLDRGVVARASEELLSRFDEDPPGFGRAPKFPNTLLLELWLRHGAREKGPEWIARVGRTFRAMSDGGVYDQLGGGFHRYSTDERWRVPHFEKMLYDNALLLRLGSQLFTATRDQEVARVLGETGDWALGEMRDESGGFWSTQDADSEGEEGRFFVWTERELRELLGERDAALFARAFGVEAGGNFEHGASVLHRPMPFGEAARLEGRGEEEAVRALQAARARLLAARAKRVRPMTDDKILAGWNGLVMQGLADAGVVLGLERFVEAARQCSDFVARELDAGGRLLRSWRRGQAKIDAFAEDYAFLAEGELSLLSATGRAVHFTRAQSYVDRALARFGDPDGGFYLSSADEELPARPRSTYDNAVPAATSSLAMALVKLAALTGEGRYQLAAEKTLARLQPAMAKNPFGHGYLLCALDAATAGLGTLVVTGGGELLEAARQTFAPNLFVLPWRAQEELPGGLASLLEGKAPGAKAYLCRAGTCLPPVENARALGRLLAT